MNECPLSRDERLNGEVEKTREKQISGEVNQEETKGQNHF